MFAPVDIEESADDVRALYNAMHAWRTLKQHLQQEGLAPKYTQVDGQLPLPRTNVSKNKFLSTYD